LEESKKSGASEKKETAPQAKRLMIFFPPSMKPRREEKINVKALTDDNLVDTTRDDQVELSINPECRVYFKNGEKTLKIQLVKGEADVEILTGDRMEVATFKATWISGKSPLQLFLTNMFIGGFAI